MVIGHFSAARKKVKYIFKNSKKWLLKGVFCSDVGVCGAVILLPNVFKTQICLVIKNSFFFNIIVKLGISQGI
jgi:hypothetical protein